MSLFLKRFEGIDSYQVIDENVNAITEWLDYYKVPARDVFFIGTADVQMGIRTPIGTKTVLNGEWIVRSDAGRFYPVARDFFVRD